MRRNLTDPAGKTMTVTDLGDGVLMPRGFPTTTPEQTKANFDHLPTFQCREDDIMLLSWPKTGTNWMYEILIMLRHKSSERQKSFKWETMVEILPQEIMDKAPSPRVLNTHVQYRFLPKELKEKRIKAVLIVRNPKDTLVSLYNHIRGFLEFEYEGEWKDWLQLYMEGEMVFGLYSDYLKQLEKAIDEGIGFPLHVIHYEDLKQNGVDEVKKLAKFLNVDIDDDLCTSIVQQCSFDAMAKAKPIETYSTNSMSYEWFNTYRKGQIGDWKNWFTVAQSEQFDSYWGKEMADSKLKFTYSPNTSPE